MQSNNKLLVYGSDLVYQAYINVSNYYAYYHLNS